VDNLINVEESVKFIDFLNHDIKKAFCLTGTYDICKCNLEQDTFEMVSSTDHETDQSFCNIFKNKEGEAFYAKSSEG
jgi:hypothetical protein